MTELSTPRLRGFAAFSPEQRAAFGRKGGLSVSPDKRAFSRSSQLARSAGVKGGAAVPADKRSFSIDRNLASEAGKKSRRPASLVAPKNE